MAGPLEGIKVLELASVVLGPWAGQMLGDMGAEVIKVEPPRGDSNRQLGPSKSPQMGALYITCNRNKRSLVLDLKQDDARSALLSLAKEADVILHNFRPKAMQKLRLDYESIAAPTGTAKTDPTAIRERWMIPSRPPAARPSCSPWWKVNRAIYQRWWPTRPRAWRLWSR